MRQRDRNVELIISLARVQPADSRFETGTLAHELLAGFVAAVEYLGDVEGNRLERLCFHLRSIDSSCANSRVASSAFSESGASGNHRRTRGDGRRRET
jgi:hypothetical protein